MYTALKLLKLLLTFGNDNYYEYVHSVIFSRLIYHEETCLQVILKHSLQNYVKILGEMFHL